MEKRKKIEFNELVEVMAQLRAPGGCPWDREQTHQSLVKYMREESQEAIHAMEANDMENLEEELGDVLLQILFHAKIAEEKGAFDIYDVVTTLKEKLVNRHPHVFAPGPGEKKWTIEDVKSRWAELKALDKEKRKKSRRS